MSVNASWWRMFLEMRKRHRFFAGDVMALGVQDVMFTHDVAETLFRERDVEFYSLPNPARNYHLSRNQRQFTDNQNHYMDIKDLFRMMPYKLSTLDAFENDKPDYQWDLCQPIPEAWHKKYDLLFDIGVLEHTADIFQALENVGNLLKVGGWMILYLPMVSPINSCMYHPNPPFYFDILSGNGFHNIHAWINWMPDWDQQNDIRTIWLNYQYNDDVYIWRPRYYTVMFCIAQKRQHAPSFKPVLQNYYKDWHGGEALFQREGTHAPVLGASAARQQHAYNWVHVTASGSPTAEQVAHFPLSELGVPYSDAPVVAPVDSLPQTHIPEQMLVGAPPREQLYL